MYKCEVWVNSQFKILVDIQNAASGAHAADQAREIIDQKYPNAKLACAPEWVKQIKEDWEI